ncbi:MAG: alpha-amylase family glycosyl hydrolase [Ignavibacteriaceae bacterium]
MRAIHVLFICFLMHTLTFPQITTIPEYPTENDSIIIILDTSQPGAEELLNYTGTLYAHTGINSDIDNWRHVIGDWGNNQNQPALIRTGTNTYQLIIGKPHLFYDVPETEQINQLAIVIRSADGSKQTRPDIFINLYESGLSVVFNNPKASVQYTSPLRSPGFAEPDDTLQIEVAAVEVGTKISSLTLYINDVQAEQTTSNILSYNLIAADYSDGITIIKAVGIDTAGIADTAWFALVINPQIAIAPVPNNLPYGINYLSSTSVVLHLYAPVKDFVYVIGDFNNWEVNPDYLMKRTPNQDQYWLQIDGLEPGKEYIFQYLVDGEIRIADPYTEKTSDPEDQFISEEIYPGLIQYPEGKTSEIASVFQTDQQEYQWQVTDFERPKKTDLVIYELLVRDFIEEHSYNALIDTIGYLRRLGVNAIELMPVMEFEGNESWGYNQSFHFAVDKYYGTKNDLKRFIDEAHKNGIAVILDIVLNHVYGESPLVRLYWNSAQGRPAANSPWFNEVSPNPEFSWGYDFNHEAYQVKNYTDRVNRFWLTEYKIDGFRFDFTKGMTNTSGDGGGHDNARINILTRMANELRKVDSTAYIILEHFAQNSEEIILSNNGMMLWGNLTHAYAEASMGWIGTSNFGSISYKTRQWAEPNLVGYMESHDEERMMYRNLNFGRSDSSYNVTNLHTALQRVKLAAAFFFTVPGPKMIWQFGELGYDVAIDDPCRVCNKPIRWEYYDDPDRNRLYKTFAALINLKQYDAFESDDFSLNAAGAVKRLNISHESMDVYVIGNFDITAKEVHRPAPRPSSCRPAGGA